MTLPEWLRHAFTPGDHNQHVASRRTVDKPENQPRPMTAAEIQKATADDA